MFEFVFQIGTYGIARMANFLNRRVYVLAESFKFARISPVNQRDLANELLVSNSFLVTVVFLCAKGDIR